MGKYSIENIEKYIYNIDSFRINNTKNFFNRANDLFYVLDDLFENKNISYDELLKELTDELLFDGSFIFTFSDHLDYITKEFEYFRTEEDHIYRKIKNLNIKSIKPLLEILIKRNFVYVPHISEIKGQSKILLEYKKIALNNEIQSLLFFPYFNENGRLEGIIGFYNKYESSLDKVDLVYINYFLSIINSFLIKDLIVKKYKAIFNNTQTGFLLLDKKGRIIEINKRAARYFGYSKDEMLNKHYEQYIHEDFLERMQYYFKNRTLVNDLPKEYLTNVVCKDQSIKILKISVILLDNNQRIMALADLTKEIEEKKRLDELMNRYRSLFKNNSSSMLLIDPQSGVIVDANDAALDYYGYDYEDITHMKISEIVQLSDEKYHEELRITNQKKKRYFNVSHRLANGNIKDVEVYTGPINIEGKEYLYSIIHDVTDKKEFQEKLEQEKRFNKTLIDTANAIIITTNKKFKTTSINRYFEDLTGINRSKMIGKDAIELLTSSNEKERVHESFNKIFSGEVSNVYSEHLLKLENGQSYHIAWKDSLLKSSSFGDQILSIGIDITQKRKNEEKLEYKYKLAKSLNKIRDIIASGKTDYNQLSEMVFNTIRVDRIEITEYANRINNMQRKTFEYVENLDYRLKDTIDAYSQEAVNELKAYILRRKTLVVENASNYSEYPALKSFLQESNLKSFITIPIINQENIYGAISFNLFNSRKYSWNEDDLEYLIQVGEIFKHEVIRKVQLEDIERTFKNTVNTLSSVVEMKDAYTAAHQLRVAILAVAIAKKMKLKDGIIEIIDVAAKLHDIGKINVPGVILSKPGKISDIEFSLIKEHSIYGYKILKKIEFEAPIAEIVHQHHERLDGTGYPRGLKSNNIYIEAKIIAVADVVEAMSSYRPYRKALGIKKALEEIKRFSGIKYDERIVKSCVELFEKENYKIPEL